MLYLGPAEKVSSALDTNGQSDGVLVIHRAEAREVDDVLEANEFFHQIYLLSARVFSLYLKNPCTYSSTKS